MPRWTSLFVLCAAAVVLVSCASNRGRQGVGSAITQAPATAVADIDVADDGLVVATWNVHEGRGDVARLLTAIGSRHVILLLQEATRRTVPRLDSLRLFVSYVPSMPNGRDDDRGCAIVSTLPIVETQSIELPWVYQRRVVVVAEIAMQRHGKPERLRVASVHLDNRPGRKRQAEWLARYLAVYAADGPLVVGGDFNTWFGAGEGTVRAIAAVLPRVTECGDRPTFRFGRHLDYLFTSLPSAERLGCTRSDETFGSDHHPIVLRLR